ncbi:MAG: hypothetical protein WAO35_26545, partial [Terriglobia bacterium]
CGACISRSAMYLASREYTCGFDLPPLARDRLIGLADSNKGLVGTLEEGEVRVCDAEMGLWQISFFEPLTERM